MTYNNMKKEDMKDMIVNWVKEDEELLEPYEWS